MDIHVFSDRWTKLIKATWITLKLLFVQGYLDYSETFICSEPRNLKRRKMRILGHGNST